MSKRKAELLIQDILEAILKIESFVAGLDLDQFEADDKTADAVIRNLEIIGEAANRIPVEVKAKFVNVEWSKIVGLRNRIVHDYFGIDLEIIWTVVQKDIPQLKTLLTQIAHDNS